METSALTGDNVEEVFMKCARTIYSKIEGGSLEAGDHSGIVEHNDRRRNDAPQSEESCGC